MLTYTLDIRPDSKWLRTTPGQIALTQPYYATEAGLFFAGRYFDTARTHKNSHLIFYTIAGEGYLSQNGEHILMEQGTALLLNCRTPQTYGASERRKYWHHFWIHVNGAGIAAMEPLLNPGARPTPIRVTDSVREFFEHVLSQITEEDTSSVLSIGLDIHQILSKMISAKLRAGKAEGDENQEMIQLAAGYIRNHYARELHMEELLSLTHLSRSYFLRLFQRYMGTTPYNFLLRHRITKAKELLETTDLPISVISDQVGFHSETNFSARFSAIAGISPGQFRKQTIIDRKNRNR